ncbi:MAG: hypothetical protein H0W66_00955, partial [Chthoniobacterales bacterium]|nr:hypothetical protein [Chthoniobacterales bacterium]
YTYLQGTSDITQFSQTVQDQGDGYATFANPSAPAKLRVTSTGAPTSGAGSTVEVHGYDANGAEVWNGAQRGASLTFGAPKALPYFSVVRELIKPVTTQTTFLLAGYDDGTEEIIGIYEPGETTPSYRRYFIPDAATSDFSQLNVNTATAIVQRRHVDLIADNDVCPIGNFGAMKHLVLAVHWTNQADEDRAAVHLNSAYRMLNDELRRLRPASEIGLIRVNARNCMATGLQQTR